MQYPTLSCSSSSHENLSKAANRENSRKLPCRTHIVEASTSNLHVPYSLPFAEFSFFPSPSLLPRKGAEENSNFLLKFKSLV
ncbi:hypothetical protein H5410_052531 [Solanum commersonii]|uniref:Uncharacterized protein n=1 Tax=Solanum commersonii TaxID=4109 RepID=A0A9J5X4D1_SOLCO|nr:hypothetical protein H5410_052531 [Solanum commersonii]